MNNTIEDSAEFLFKLLASAIKVACGDRYESCMPAVEDEQGTHTNLFSIEFTTAMSQLVGLHLRAEFTCSCGTIATRTQHEPPEYLWNLDLEDGSRKYMSVSSAMKATLAKKMLDEKCKCPQCSRMGTTYREWRLMLPLPSILVIQLKRWKSNESKRAAPRELVTHAVRIQSVLNLDKAKYELAAVVRMHTEGAHYTAFAKRWKRPNETVVPLQRCTRPSGG